MKKTSEQTYTMKEVQENLDRYLNDSAVILRSSISRYSNISLKKVTSLAGSLRKAFGIRMLKKIRTSRKSDW